MPRAKCLFALLTVAPSTLLAPGCLALSFGGKHVSSPRNDEESPAVQEKLRSLDARVRNLEQGTQSASPAAQPAAPSVQQILP